MSLVFRDYTVSDFPLLPLSSLLSVPELLRPLRLLVPCRRVPSHLPSPTTTFPRLNTFVSPQLRNLWERNSSRMTHDLEHDPWNPHYWVFCCLSMNSLATPELPQRLGETWRHRRRPFTSICRYGEFHQRLKYILLSPFLQFVGFSRVIWFNLDFCLVTR